MIRDLIESIYSCHIIQWDEFDGDRVTFSAIQHGELIVADSLDLLILALAPALAWRVAA